MSPNGRREGDVFNKEWCEQRATWCEQMNVKRDATILRHNKVLHERIDKIDNRLWAILVIIVVGLFKEEIKNWVTHVPIPELSLMIQNLGTFFTSIV